MLGPFLLAVVAVGTTIIRVDPQWDEGAAKCGDSTIARPSKALLATIQLAADDATPRRADTTTITLRPCLEGGKLAEAGREVIALSVSELRSLIAYMSWQDELGEIMTRRFLAFVIAHERQHFQQPKSADACPAVGQELEADRNARVPMGRLVLIDLMTASLARYRSALRGDPDHEPPERCVELLERSIRVYAHTYDRYVTHATDASAEVREQRQLELVREHAQREEIFDLVLPHCMAVVEHSGTPCHRQRLAAIAAHRRDDPHGPPPTSWRDPQLRGPTTAFTDDARFTLSPSIGFGMHGIDEPARERRTLVIGPRTELLGAVWWSRLHAAIGPMVSHQALLRAGRPAEHRVLVGVGGLVLPRPTGRFAHGLTAGLAWAHELRAGADVDGLELHGGWTGTYRARPRLHVLVRVTYELVAELAELRQSRFHSHGGVVGLGIAAQLGRHSTGAAVARRR